VTLTVPSPVAERSPEKDEAAGLVARALAAYEGEQPDAASLRIATSEAAIAKERRRDAVSAAHGLAGRLGTTLDELPRDAVYRCDGDRPLAAFQCAELPPGLLVTTAGNWGFGGRLLSHPLRLLDRDGGRSGWFDGLEGLGRELRRYHRGGERFGR
jgi:hypothetical protein